MASNWQPGRQFIAALQGAGYVTGFFQDGRPPLAICSAAL
jgi:hypothetical protein